jgi:hypothetical protein
MGEQRLLSPEELAALFKRLDGLIEEARTLQQQITDRLLVSRRQDRQDRSGQPVRTERRRVPRKK